MNGSSAGNATMRPNARDSSSRLRTGVQSRACHLQGSNGLRAIHCREIEQELFQWFPSFQVVEQVLYGRTRPAEHGDTALNPWVFLYDLIVHCRLLNAGTEKVTTPRSATGMRTPCHRCTRRSSWHQQQQAVEWEREGRRFWPRLPHRFPWMAPAGPQELIRAGAIDGSRGERRYACGGGRRSGRHRRGGGGRAGRGPRRRTWTVRANADNATAIDGGIDDHGYLPRDDSRGSGEPRTYVREVRP